MPLTRTNRTGMNLLAAVVAALTALSVVPAATADVTPSAPPLEVAGAGVPATRTATTEGLPIADVNAAAVGSVARSAPLEAPIPFAMVGLSLPEGASARLRTSSDGDAWSAWGDTEPVDGEDHGPDEGTTEAAASTTSGLTEPVWTGAARFLQVEVEGAAPADVDATFIDTLGQSGVGVAAVADDPSTVTAAHSTSPFPRPTMPGVVSRASWGADEALPTEVPAYALDGVRFAVVHHTAGSNDYSAAEAPAVVRGILAYHTEIQGWNDIGYNVLVDRFGTVYEGRAGGFDNAVVGAHAQGFNTGAVGIAMIGSFHDAAPPKPALDAAAQTLAWIFKRHGVDPGAGVKLTSGGSNRYPLGQVVPMSTLFGHRDAGETGCPGTELYKRLPALRTDVARRISLLGPLPPAPAPVILPVHAPREPSFTDIADTVHASNIETLARAGVTGGCGRGRFCPDGKVTRAQAVSFIVRAGGMPAGPGGRFVDVPAGHIHAEVISAAVRAGFVTGYGDGTFRPEALVSRAQLASLLAKAKGLARRPGQYFSDVPWTSVHLANVNAIGEAGLSGGCGGGRYCPDNPTSRAELASFVANAYER